MYSLYENNWEKNVILNDKYDKVYAVWDFLINHASVKNIKKLPNLTEGLNIDNLKISESEKILLGFYANPASSTPKKTVSKRGEISWNRHKSFLIENLHKVKHWKITNKSYDELKNLKATYFIDPPYQFGGEYYHSASSNKHLNYDDLAKWCLSRKGEIIVCENNKADWLNFKPLTVLNGQLHKTKEVFFHKIQT